MPPTGEEARAQRRETAMPLFWGIIGVLIVIVFVAFLTMRSGYRPFSATGRSAAPSLTASPGAGVPSKRS